MVRRVGVVGDVRQSFRDEAPLPEVYRPWARAYWPLLHVAVRTDGGPNVLPRLRAALQQAVPDQPLAALAQLDDVIATGSRQAHALGRVMAACAVTAAVLAVIGLYGLLTSEMLARRREVGIRLALGARAWRLRTWLLRPGLWVTAAGVVLGLLASVPAARLLEQQLFGVRSDDLGVRVAAACILLLAGLLAALVPAYRVVKSRIYGLAFSGPGPRQRTRRRGPPLRMMPTARLRDPSSHNRTVVKSRDHGMRGNACVAVWPGPCKGHSRA